MVSAIYLSLFSFLVINSIANAPREFQFVYNSHMIPHPQKAYRGGEDAFYNSSKLLIVADGVGGWNNQGVDPSIYSRFLCSSAQRFLKENRTKYLDNPLELIKRAQKQNDNIGSATMVAVTLSGSNLKYCYLGDSGFMVFRRFQKLISIYQFVQQQHRFNFPFQLALQRYGGDNPQHSICGTIQIKNGDIIVVGSDGLFDNVDFHEIQNEVRKADRTGTILSKLSQHLARMAIKRGQNPIFNSPFAQKAKLQNLIFKGGKLDDTTVIVAEIRTSTQNQQINQL